MYNKLYLSVFFLFASLFEDCKETKKKKCMSAGEVLTISLLFLFVNDWSSPLKLLLRRKQRHSAENSELHWLVYTEHNV